MPKNIVIFVLFLACFGTTIRAQGQAAEVKPRPRIGLALAGGAALGLAHVGVLEWFDQHHIPIDYLAGTSMGGLVGGCYCVGMEPDEMHIFLKDLDWDELVSVGPAYETLNFRRKQDMRAVPSNLSVGLRNGVQLPEGLSAANSVALLLSRISLPYSEIRNFDELPTPFRCMAVDLKSGEAVTLRDGSLATALRATMALPLIFTPVERDGRLLVDGGALNNIPTEAVKQMGADIVIAVDLSGSFFQDKTSGSFVDILSRTTDVMTYANERQSLKLADIILTPDLNRLTVDDFDRVDTFAERGYKAAEARAGILERFALNDADWKNYVAQRNARKRSARPAPAFVETTAADPNRSRILQSQLKSLVNGHANSFSTTRLEQKLNDIVADGRYESLQYQLVHRDGREGLLLYAKEKRYGPPFLRFGLDVNGADPDNIRTDFIARLIDLEVGSPGAETRTDLRLGSDQQVAFEYYRPLDGPIHWFLAPHVAYNDTSLELYHQGARVAIYGNRTAGAGLDLGYNTSRTSELRFGYEYDYEGAAVRTGSPVLPSLSGDVSAARLRWEFDGQDSPMIPTRGNRGYVKSTWYFAAPGATKSFTTTELRLSSFHPLPNRASFFGALDFGTTFGGRAAPLQQFTAGGPLRLGAYSLDELRGNDSLIASLGYLHPLLQLPSVVGGKVMLGSWYEAGGAFQSFGHARYLNDISIGIMAETLIGPIIVGYSYGEHGNDSVYFSLGRIF